MGCETLEKVGGSPLKAILTPELKVYWI